MNDSEVKSQMIEQMAVEQTQIRIRLARLRESLKTEVDPDTDEGDLGMVEHEITLTLVLDLEHKLQSLEAAMQRATQDTYGLCERCGAPIDLARLEALPETTFCIECKVIVERQIRPGGRELASARF